MEEVRKTARDVIEHRISTADIDERDCSSLLADAVIAALDAAGLVIVPKEPTEAMRHVQVPTIVVPGDTAPFVEFWYAMIEAASLPQSSIETEKPGSP